MSRRLASWRLLVGSIAVLLLAGCAAGASPKPVTFGPVTVVTGAATCPGLDFDWTTDPNGTMHVRGDYHADRCTVTTDDPRVSGLRSSTWNMDLWGNPDAGQWAVVQWGTPRLENDGGAWEGRATGISSSPGRGDIIANWYKGTGGYAGLGYFELWTGGLDGPWKIQGQIFPGDPPPPYAKEATGTGRPEAGGPVADDAVAVVTGTAECPDLDLDNFDMTTDPDGTKHLRDDYDATRCTLTTDDPRVSGVRSSNVGCDLWGNVEIPRVALVMWGTARLENDGGAWEGAFSGVGSAPGRGDIGVNWYKGTGGYEGLSYFELHTGNSPYKIEGLIFPGDPPTP